MDLSDPRLSRRLQSRLQGLQGELGRSLHSPPPSKQRGEAGTAYLGDGKTCEEEAEALLREEGHRGELQYRDRQPERGQPDRGDVQVPTSTSNHPSTEPSTEAGGPDHGVSGSGPTQRQGQLAQSRLVEVPGVGPRTG